MYRFKPRTVYHRRNLRPTHRKGAVPVLPPKTFHARKGLLNPGRRAALDQLCNLGWRQHGRCAEQQVNMIFDSADLQGLHLILLGDAAKIGPNALLNVRFYPKLPILGAEDDVVMQRRVRVCHDVQPSLRDAPQFWNDSKPWVETHGYRRNVAT